MACGSPVGARRRTTGLVGDRLGLPCGQREQAGPDPGARNPRRRRAGTTLIAKCDIVMENFSPRVMTNLGLDWDTVSAANPAALMVRMPAFGLDRALARPGRFRSDHGAGQWNGLDDRRGRWVAGHPARRVRSDRRPARGVRHHRRRWNTAARTGRGALVEVTMVEAALNVAAQLVIEHRPTGRP